jgi:predicted ATPase/DNA-binding CsgD family transcriptional regulator
LGEEAYAGALADHHRLIRIDLAAYGGQEISTQGDGFFAVFSSPRACVTAVIEMQRVLSANQWPAGEPVRVRMGVHCGEASETSTAGLVGFEVHRAARVAAVAHGGQVVLSATAAALVRDSLPAGVSLRDLGPHRLKDLGQPEQLFQLQAEGLEVDFPPLRSLDNPELANNLPSYLSAFIGREVEVAEVRSLVQSSRLVTLTGAGGSGKTRLALQVAAELLDGSGEGVWFVDLAAIAENGQVPGAVFAALGIREQAGRPLIELLLEVLGDRRALIVLDNCEHVVDACAKLAELVNRGCPKVHLVITSLEPLGIDGERVYRVRPLSLPSEEATSVQDLQGSDAVELFVERARSHDDTFVLEDSIATLVASICRRLDGIPFAIELAAARLSAMSLVHLNERLDQRFRLLTGGSRNALARQRTLQAMVDWSFDLLNDHEKEVLCRLSVFVGGFELDAAEAVCATRAVEVFEIADLLASLVNKSLVVAERSSGSLRYRLLETIRQYAGERLAQRAGPVRHETRAAHRDHYLALVEAADTHLRGRDEATWLDRLEVELDNVRAALAFSIADLDSAEPGLRLAAGLRWFCYMRGHAGEVLEALNILLERRGDPTPGRARAITASCHLLNHFGNNPALPSLAGEAIRIGRGLLDDAVTADALSMLCWFRFEHDGDLPAALADIDEAVGLARRAGDRRLIAEILGRRAVFESDAGDLGAALADLDETLALSRATGDNYRLAITLASLGIRELGAGDRRAARAHLEEANTLADKRGYQHLSAGLRLNLGFVDLLDSDPRLARSVFLDVLDTARLSGVRAYVHGAILGLAMAAAADSDPTVAATLYGVADEQYEQAGRVFEAIEAGLRDRDHAQLRATLGDAAFEIAYRHGRTLSQVEAVALATAAAELDPGAANGVPVPAAGQATPGSASVLSEREREIVALLAGGATDAQIADRLYLSVNSVRSHLERIRDKTGARRRAELVRYAVQSGIDPVTPPA